MCRHAVDTPRRPPPSSPHPAVMILPQPIPHTRSTSSLRSPLRLFSRPEDGGHAGQSRRGIADLPRNNLLRLNAGQVDDGQIKDDSRSK